MLHIQLSHKRFIYLVTMVKHNLQATSMTATMHSNGFLSWFSQNDSDLVHGGNFYYTYLVSRLSSNFSAASMALPGLSGPIWRSKVVYWKQNESIDSWETEPQQRCYIHKDTTPQNHAYGIILTGSQKAITLSTCICKRHVAIIKLVGWELNVQVLQITMPLLIVICLT